MLKKTRCWPAWWADRKPVLRQPMHVHSYGQDEFDTSMQVRVALQHRSGTESGRVPMCHDQ